MRLVFMGTPEFAVPTLEAILTAGHSVAAVLTQPDRPKGRGQELAPSPVKETALRAGLPVWQPERVRRPEVVEQLAALQSDAMVVVGYGQIIPQNIIDLPRFGIINVHASLLPKYRGAAPVQWAIARGETVTGVTTMRIDAGLDTGDILLVRQTPVGPEEDAVSVGRRLAVLGAQLLVETLDGLERGTVRPRPQDSTQATLAPVLRKEDGLVDWGQPAATIANRQRGFQPWPGAYTQFRGQRLHLSRVRAMPSSTTERVPGAIWAEERRLQVACGQGSILELLELQLEGRKKITAQDFRNGVRLNENERLGELH